MKPRKRRQRRVPNLLIIFYIVLFVVFVSYFLASFLHYVRVKQEYDELRRATEMEKKELKEKEETIRKLEELFKSIEEEQRKSVLNQGTTTTQEASGF